jgi:hypothetical protein
VKVYSEKKQNREQEVKNEQGEARILPSSFDWAYRSHCHTLAISWSEEA